MESVTDKAVTERLCSICEAELIGVRRDARYCSNACRQRAYRLCQKVEKAGGLIAFIEAWEAQMRYDYEPGPSRNEKC